MIGSLLLVLVVAGGSAGHEPRIQWERRFDQALRRAREQKKPVMVDFWARWCGWCLRLDRTTYVDPVVVRLAEDFVAVKVDTDSGPKAEEIAARYDVASLPTILFLTPSGRVVSRLSAFQGPGQFPKTLAAAKETAEQVMAWEAALDRDGADPGALLHLGEHSYRQESYEEAHQLLSRALKVDAALPPTKRKRIRMLLGIMAYYSRKHDKAEELLKQGLEIAPPDEYDAKLLYTLGRTYLAQHRTREARAALKAVLEKYPGSYLADEARQALAALDRERK